MAFLNWNVIKLNCYSLFTASFINCIWYCEAASLVLLCRQWGKSRVLKLRQQHEHEEFCFFFFSVCIQSVTFDPPFNFSVLTDDGAARSRPVRGEHGSHVSAAHFYLYVDQWVRVINNIFKKQQRNAFIDKGQGHFYSSAWLTCLKTHTWSFSIETATQTGNDVSPCSCLGWITRCCQTFNHVSFVLFCFVFKGLKIIDLLRQGVYIFHVSSRAVYL